MDLIIHCRSLTACDFLGTFMLIKIIFPWSPTWCLAPALMSSRHKWYMWHIIGLFVYKVSLDYRSELITYPSIDTTQIVFLLIWIHWYNFYLIFQELNILNTIGVNTTKNRVWYGYGLGTSRYGTTHNLWIKSYRDLEIVQ